MLNSRLSPNLLLLTRQKVYSCCKSKHQHQCLLYVHHGPCRSLAACPLSPQTTVMSQVEKKAGLLRRTSSSKKPLKEKVVLMYDDIFSVSIKRGRCSHREKLKFTVSLCLLGLRRKTQQKTILAFGMSCFSWRWVENTWHWSLFESWVQPSWLMV